MPKHSLTGIYTDTNGYMVTTKGHRYLHRLLIEQSLGRSLRTTEHVHHLNGKKTDNRLKNLEILSSSEHQKLHHPRHPDFLERKRVSNRKSYWKYRKKRLPIMRVRGKAHYWKNRKRILAYWKTFRNTHVNLLRERKRRYYFLNRKRILQSQKEYKRKKRETLRLAGIHPATPEASWKECIAD